MRFFVIFYFSYLPECVMSGVSLHTLLSGGFAKTRGVSGPMRGSRHTDRPSPVCVSSSPSLLPPPPFSCSSSSSSTSVLLPFCVCFFKAEPTLDSLSGTDCCHNVCNKNDNSGLYLYNAIAKLQWRHQKIEGQRELVQNVFVLFCF